MLFVGRKAMEICMKKYTKILAYVLSAVLCLGFFSGCSSKNETDGAEDNTISFWIANSNTSIIKNYDEIDAIAEWQKRMNVDIEFFHPSSGNETEQFNIMAASGDFKDVVNYNWNGYAGGPVRAASDGAILVLDDYIEKYMPNLLNEMKADSHINYLARAYDGSVCVIPGFSDSLITASSFGPAIRKDWLDKLGLEVPKTIDDWYNVLTAFKTKDPNGNGLADEIPFVADGTATFTRFSRAWEGVQEHFYVDGEGKVRYGFIEPQYKEFLIEINKWYKEGLIDPEYAATNASMINTKMVSGVGGSFVGYSGSGLVKYMLAGRETDPNFTLVGTQWPTHNGGQPWTGYPYQAERGTLGKGMAISAKCANIETTLKTIDFLYGKEGVELMNWGIEGVTYNKNGEEKQFTDLVLANPEGKTPVETITKYALVQYGFAKGDSEAFMQINSTLPEQREAMKLWNEADISRVLPSLSISPEEQDIITGVLDDVLTYRVEWMNKFIMGVEPIDKWEEVCENIRDLGIDKATEVYQKAYDRKLKQK